VSLLNLRVLDNNGSGTDSSVIAAIQRAVQLQSQYNIRVINLSLGRPVSISYANDPLCQAVQKAWNAGIVVVVAAGNDGRNNSAGTNGYATIGAPGNSPFAITVGAMNTMGTPSRADDKITSYSSKGPTLFDHVVKPDLVAPGNRIISLESYAGAYLATTYPKNDVPQWLYLAGSGNATNWYYQLSGTSMAAPMVSGAAALLVQKNPHLTPDQVKAILMTTASKFGQTSSVATDPVTGISYTSQYDIFTVGAGYLDIPAALASNDLATGSAQSPVAAYDSATGKVYLGGRQQRGVGDQRGLGHQRSLGHQRGLGDKRGVGHASRLGHERHGRI
jgi:serine protease AprX